MPLSRIRCLKWGIQHKEASKTFHLKQTKWNRGDQQVETWKTGVLSTLLVDRLTNVPGTKVGWSCCNQQHLLGYLQSHAHGLAVPNTQPLKTSITISTSQQEARGELAYSRWARGSWSWEGKELPCLTAMPYSPTTLSFVILYISFHFFIKKNSLPLCQTLHIFGQVSSPLKQISAKIWFGAEPFTD